MKKHCFIGRNSSLWIRTPEEGEKGACVIKDMNYCISTGKSDIILSFREAAKLRDWLSELLKGTKY